MIAADLPANEEERLKHLYELDILDTFEEQAYDDLTNIAAEICGTPIALVSLVDEHRQWFKSHYGLNVRETPRDIAFCSHAILNDDVFVVEDSSKDERFHDNPLYTGEPHVRFYAGAPLIIRDNISVGTLCVISDQPRTISSAQKETLKTLARQVVSQLKLRLKIKELEKLDHIKDEFICMVSHELRTPLTAIFGSLSLLISSNPEPAVDNGIKLVEMAYRNTKRLLNIVNDILDISKIDSGSLELDRKKTGVIKLVKNSIELNEQYCSDCHTSISFTPPEDVPEIYIYGDEQRLLQVMSNLISNAAKFTHDNDTVVINITPNTDSVLIEVTDHGPGITSDNIDLLFKKFQQINSHINNKLPGTGLGLNISKNIVELHHGSIGASSVPNVETTFYFTLPLYEEH